MDQYYQILSSCRIPGPKRDTVVNYATGKIPSSHITVVHNFQVLYNFFSYVNSILIRWLKQPSVSLQFFVLDVYNSDGTPLTVDQLHMQLEKIWNSSLQTNKEPIGILTSQHRNTWGKAYNNLIKGGQRTSRKADFDVRKTVRDKYIALQIRQTRSQCVPFRRASSPFVWMHRCHACLMKCTGAVWLRRCCTEGEPAGTVETAGSTRRYRSVSAREPITYDRF